MTMPMNKPESGFTLIEIAITLVVMAVLLAIAIPSFGVMMQNLKIKASAESLSAAIQQARSEAVKRNRTVEFILTADPVTSFDTTNYSATGPNWIVRVPDTSNNDCSTDSPGSYCLIDAKAGSEGSARGTPIVIDGGGVSVIQYSGLGRASAAAVFALSIPSAGDCVQAGGKFRCLDVTVSSSGQVRLCDPAATTPGDTRAC